MDRVRRIILGALTGALLTLLLHPASRRYAFTPFLDLGRSEQKLRSEWIGENLTVLPVPADTIHASLWTQAGAERIVEGKPLDDRKLEQLIDVCTAAARGEPNNGYWKQMEAVFLWNAGRRNQALESWKQASLCDQWDDYQSRRLAKLRDELQRVDGGQMAWHTVAAYYERTVSGAVALLEFARTVFRTVKLPSEELLELKVATLRNGRLLREWSRSVQVGTYGAQLVDLVTLPPGRVGKLSIREEILARFEIVNRLRLVKKPREALEVDEIFRTNDAWMALAEPTRAADHARQNAWAAMLAATVPGILFGIALIGAGLRLIMWLFEALPKAQVVLQPPYAPAMGVLVGIGLYLQTGLVLAAVAVSMCFGFLAFEPDRKRKRMPSHMGPAFRWTVTALAAVFFLLVGGFWFGIATPGLEVMPSLGIPMDVFGGNTIFLSLAVLVLSLLLLAAPAWAMVERIPTPFATVFTIREFSKRLAWGGLALGVLAIPIAVYFDRQTRESMDRLLANEPAVYLLREQ